MMDVLSARIKKDFEVMRSFHKPEPRRIQRVIDPFVVREDHYVTCNNCKKQILKSEAYSSIRGGKKRNVCKNCMERIG